MHFVLQLRQDLPELLHEQYFTHFDCLVQVQQRSMLFGVCDAGVLFGVCDAGVGSRAVSSAGVRVGEGSVARGG